MTLTRIRVPGVITPYYVHTPSSCVYEYPTVTPIPVGMYSNGIMTLNPNYVGNGGFGAGYLSRPVETPYSAAALALQAGKYPVTTMCVPNGMAYPATPYYGAQAGYSDPYGMRYGMYGQRGLLM